MKRTLAIETSCDDTSIAVVSFDGDSFYVENSFSYSQIENHSVFGGVVPEVASRLHNEKILSLLESLGREWIENVDFISVTSSPGLPGSLLVGKTMAFMLGNIYNKEVVEVNHIYGHIFSVFLERSVEDFDFPAVVLTASGGHNDLYLIEKIKDLKNGADFDCFDIKKIGATIDDAAGEAFDKAAKMLWGPYPGGGRISQKASLSSGNEKVRLKRVFLGREEYNFSFSGVKSKIYYLLEDLKKDGIEIDEELTQDICYEFQESVVEVLGKKIMQAVKEFEARNIRVVGGVSSNDRLFEYINDLKEKRNFPEIEVFKPYKKEYSTDNAAMIGVAGMLYN